MGTERESVMGSDGGGSRYREWAAEGITSLFR